VSVVSRLRRRAGDGERGAVIVEFALVAMLLATLAFGTIEYSYGWRSSMSVLTAARGGARSVSSTGNDNQSDYFALTSIKANLDSAGLLEGAQRVVVYKADATNGDPPAACLVTPITATTEKCNIYTGDQLRGVLASQFNAAGCMTLATVKNYCPTSRATAQGSADSIGVYVQAKQKSLTGFFGGAGFLASRDAVMRMEPS
jgi:Flp pilus assembly protein TadG